MLVLAVTLHNIPEGMAVGVAFAGLLADNGTITMAGALALAIGIAIQNFPEGAIISLPLKEAAGRNKAFVYGMLSGIVEPIGAGIMLALSDFLGPALPYMLSFAAGAMVYVVVEELIPESAEGEHSNIGDHWVRGWVCGDDDSGRGVGIMKREKEVKENPRPGISAAAAGRYPGWGFLVE